MQSSPSWVSVMVMARSSRELTGISGLSVPILDAGRQDSSVVHLPVLVSQVPWRKREWMASQLLDSHMAIFSHSEGFNRPRPVLYAARGMYNAI